jgi:hypothetical protein
VVGALAGSALTGRRAGAGLAAVVAGGADKGGAVIVEAHGVTDADISREHPILVVVATCTLTIQWSCARVASVIAELTSSIDVCVLTDPRIAGGVAGGRRAVDEIDVSS